MALTSDKIRYASRLNKRQWGTERLHQTRKAIIEPESSMYDNEGWSAGKREQRRAVLDTFVSTQGNAFEPSILTLPGELWSFEQEFRRIYAKSRVVGFEKNVTTYQRAIKHIPYEGRVYSHSWKTPTGTIDVTQSGKCWLFNANIIAFFRDALKPKTDMDGVLWDSHVRSFDMVWIDGTSPLGCDTTLAILRGVSAVLTPRRPSVFAITFTIGRDKRNIRKMFDLAKGDALTRRCSFIKEYLKHNGCDLNIAEVVQHKSANCNGSLTLGTVIGTVPPEDKYRKQWKLTQKMWKKSKKRGTLR